MAKTLLFLQDIQDQKCQRYSLSNRNSPLGNVLTPSSTQVMQECCQSPSRGDALWRTSSWELPSWVNRLQSFSLPPHPSWKAFKVCEAGGLCSKPWDCLPPAGNFPYRCLPHSYHFQRWPLLWLWRPAPTLHEQWFGHQSSLTDLMKLLVKHLTKYWVGQTVCSGFSITQTNWPTQK